ncbi:hypothetical protein Plhal304r1_c011g0043391 [Plasmopara halstedii]
MQQHPSRSLSSQSVGHLKKTIKKKKLEAFDADQLELHLAKNGESWLTENEVKNGLFYRRMTGSYRKSRCTCCNPRSRIINGNLAAESTQISVTVVEGQDTEGFRQELTYYQHRGRLIQDKCRNYCAHILDKIDELSDGNETPIPFICVEGLSGIGKSQLAFALGGWRPWYYWMDTSVGSQSQRLYRNFTQISNAFDVVVQKDTPKKKATESVLNCVSSIYQNDLLWTYGFICALLKYCSSAEHQSAQQMIWFDNATRFNVKPYKREIVFALINKMKAEKKVLPFFVLDEMRPNENIEAGGMNTSAF